MGEAFIKLDFACNQKCLFCCTADDIEKITFDQAKALVSKYAKEMGYKQISFTGGEPTVVRYLPKIISFSKSLGVKVKIQTNALLLADPVYAKMLVESGLDYSLVSIHSFDDTINDEITQVKGSLKKSLKGIANLIRYGIPVDIAYVITTLNEDILRFILFMEKRFPKIKNFQFFVPWAIARGWKNKHLVPRFKDIHKNLIKAFEYCENKKIEFSTRGIPLCFLGKYEHHSVETRALLSKEKPMMINDFIDMKPRHSFKDSNCKEPQCASCIKNSICGGVWNTYPKIYPGEIIPIKTMTNFKNKKQKRDRRLELLVGYTCNNNCLFCYVTPEREKFKDKTTTELKEDIINSRKRGTKELSFLGGEPTLRKDIFELTRFAVKQGFTHVKITTNGRMLSYPQYTAELVKAGITKVLFSLHGPNAEIHDKLTRANGSFEQLMKGVKKVKKYHDVIIETNSTITKQNYKHLEEMARLFIKLKMLSSEFIFIFPHGNALIEPKKNIPMYTEAKPFMEKALDTGKNSKTKILMRYVPYCILPNHIQGIADQYDPPEREQIGPGVETLDVIKARKELDRAHVPQCKGCKYEKDCEGPWKVYPSIYGINEFKRLI